MTTTGAHPGRVARGSVAEWVFDARGHHPNPYTDVVVAAEFRGPGGQVRSIEGFYDGQRFRVRFSPDEEGTWQVRVVSRPHDDGLCLEDAFEVLPGTGGPARVAPGTGWGFTDARGRPLFVLGDTAYHLFGMAHCGADVAGYLRRRREQGFDLVRVRVPVSPFHPPNGHNDWQTRSCWPWGGSPQHPLFDRFDAAWFATVDRVVAEASRIGIGLELVVEGWGTEFPFNARGTFTAEWEDLWLRHLVARYDAWDSVWIWTLMNEYEFYPDGVPRYDRVADLWALRMARRLKQLAPHGKAVAVHNGPPGPPFAERFAVDPGAIDAVMVQSWGSHDAREGWLATGLETRIGELLDGWRGSALLSEYGYERNPAPEFLYRAGGGPLFDMGPYYLTALVAALGPVRRVSAVGSRPGTAAPSVPAPGRAPGSTSPCRPTSRRCWSSPAAARPPRSSASNPRSCGSGSSRSPAPTPPSSCPTPTTSTGPPGSRTAAPPARSRPPARRPAAASASWTWPGRSAPASRTGPPANSPCTSSP
ncbi:apiosidase-like domain-containing protein [Kitasatospora cineracea]|uniref:apiosidase-like domain-containing protein n=1 Tax=Kitasatospora cineracea TaxID=88074 RepID=UPI0037BA6C6E